METKLNNMNEILTAAEAVASPPSPSWIELPEDVTLNILQRLGSHEILQSARKVCSTWRKACLDPATWRVIELDYAIRNSKFYNCMYRCVVDRSQGQLIDLKIYFLGDVQLIHYIVDRSSHLRRLTVVSCDSESGTALSEALKKLPQLEELHIINRLLKGSVDAKDIEAIGISCPMLKSFSYNYSFPIFTFVDEATDSKYRNEYALAIGKTMPNLRHLQLLENGMKNEGLEAILDGCPHLESLDIRGCSGLDLRGALGKRCSQQIKNLIDPSDPYEKGSMYLILVKMF